MVNSVTVVGAGAWGTALALVVARASQKVTLFTREDVQARLIHTDQCNERRLPGVPFDRHVAATSNPETLKTQDIIVFAVPAQATRQVALTLKQAIFPETLLVVTAKGIEHGTSFLMSEVLGEIFPKNPLAILSGPTFAGEVARGLPAAAIVAAGTQALAAPVVQAFSTPSFRPYLSTDIIGAQMGGAVKNVLAIAAGIVEGSGLGDNARAALISRGMSELVRLGLAKGGKLDTFLGLSGYGDVVLTCTSRQSRNMSYGYELARGNPREDVLREGVFTAQSVMALSQKLRVDMPICASVYRMITKKSSVTDELKVLMGRPLRKE